MITNGLQAAAAAAERARAAAEAARAQADSAPARAAAVALELVTSQRAEIEAGELLEKAKNPKDADPAAAEILKVGQPVLALETVVRMFPELQSPPFGLLAIVCPAWLGRDPESGQLPLAWSDTGQVLLQVLLRFIL